MNGKQRLFAALNREPSDVVPVAPCFPNIYLRQPEYQAYLDAYRARMGDATEYPLDPDEDNQIIFESKVKSLEAWVAPQPDNSLGWRDRVAALRDMPDWIGVTRSPTRAVQARSVIQLRGDEFVLVDPRKPSELNLTDLTRGDSNELMRERTEDLAAMRDLSHEQVDERIPIISAQDLLASGAFEVPKKMMARFKDDYFMHAVISTPYTSAKYAAGLIKTMHMLREEKPLLHYIAERAYHAAVELTRAWAGLRVDAIYFQETLSAADFIAPADYDEFVFPTTKALTQECQKLGMKAILYLTGNSMPRLPRLMEMSLDGLGVEESRKNFVVDIAKVREQVGNDLCLFGNIDAYGILEIGSDDQLQAELERQWRGGANASGTAFAMSPGSPITPGTTRERVRDFIRRTRELKLQRLPSP